MSKNELIEINETAHPLRLIELAVQGGADISTLEKLMDLQERFEAIQARKAFYAALSKFQALIPVIPKNGNVSFPHGNGRGMTEYTFPLLDDIATAIRPALSECGLSYRYEQKQDQQAITVVCIVSHEAGFCEKLSMSGSPDGSGKKNPIQQIASTVSYLRRYTLTGSLGITAADIDDDAQASPAPDSAPAQQKLANTYPEEQYSNMYPKWKQLIESGSKTAADIIRFIEKKGMVLGPEHARQLNNLKASTVENN